MGLLIKKTLLDFIARGKQGVIAFLSIFAGMTFFGLMLFSDVVSNREIFSVYRKADPMSFSVTVEGKTGEEKMRGVLSKEEEIDVYEIRPVISMECRTGSGDWKPVTVFGVDFETGNTINRINVLDEGAFPAQIAAFLEKGAEGVAGVTAGETLVLRDRSGKEQSVSLSGLVNDMFVHPAYIHQCVYLYMNRNEAERLGTADYLALIRVTGDPYNPDTIREVSDRVVSELGRTGVSVEERSIPDPPGESMHADEYRSTLFLLRMFSFGALIFGCITVAVLAASVFHEQVKQIGILKACGVSSAKILASYAAALFLIISAAGGLALVCSLAGTAKLCEFLLSLGNIMTADTSVPFGTVALYAGLILFLPMTVVMVPLVGGLKITVREAISDYGITKQETPGKGRFRFNGFTVSIRIAIRNVFARKKQFFINTGFLVLGGLLFLLVVTTSESMKSSLNGYLDGLHYDYEFDCDLETRSLWEQNADSLENVASFEVWKTSLCRSGETFSGV